MDIEVRASTLGAPHYPHSSVLSSIIAGPRTAYLLGDDLDRFIIANADGVTVLAGGNALTSSRFRRHLADWTADFSWDRLQRKVLWLKTHAGTSFVVAVVAAHRIAIFGDVFGTMPIYYAAGGEVIATNPDAVGHAAGAPYDPLSYADMTVTKRVCHPFTLYEGVRQLSPTAYLDLEAGTMAVLESGYKPPRVRWDAIADSAAATLQRLVADHLEGQRALVAISGGLDSRVLAVLAKRTTATRSFSITEMPSRDATIGALAARHRDIPHETLVCDSGQFARVAPRLLQFATSQNSARHAHFGALGADVTGTGELLVSGYGANANFERYDSKRQVLERIAAANLPDAVKAELTERWRAHSAYVRGVFGRDARYLCTVWPATQKKAYAFVHTNRNLMPTFDPFLLLPEMFSAKSVVARHPSDLARSLFRIFCADELHLPTTRTRHPLGVVIEEDQSSGQGEAGWPRKDGMFRFGKRARTSPRLRHLQPEDDDFFKQMCAIEATWNADAAAGSIGERLLRRLRG